MSLGTGRQNIIILFWKQLFHFWEYINGNQTFILDFHQPFIYSVPSVLQYMLLYSHLELCLVYKQVLFIPKFMCYSTIYMHTKNIKSIYQCTHFCFR
jgi:hypothetical protein